MAGVHDVDAELDLAVAVDLDPARRGGLLGDRVIRCVTRRLAVTRPTTRRGLPVA
jgi:hypothetical protein